MANPFTYDRPLPPDQLIDRGNELAKLAELAGAGQSTRLAAPRRYGKTTLLGALDRDLHRQGWLVVYVDFSKARDLADVVERLRRGWARASQVHRKARELQSQIRRHISFEIGVPGVAKAHIEPSQQRREPLELMHELLELPAEVGDAKTLVIFDEFPDLLTAADDLDGVVRSHAQHHAGMASYCYAGSQMSMMAALFEDKRRPLFGQARKIGLGPLQHEDLVAWISDRDPRIEENVAAELAERSSGHPQRAMMLAHFLWEQPHRTLADLEGAQSTVVEEASGEIRQAWDSLTTAQRRILRAAAEGHSQLLSKESLTSADLEKSSAQKARDALLRDGHLYETPHGHAPIDPLIAFWLRAG